MNFRTGRNNPYYKDALGKWHVAAYAIGHLANDLIINVWNTYSTWYHTQAAGVSDENSGLIVLIGQIIDAIAQPSIAIASDSIETRWGKRMPWYVFGHIVALPCFYYTFNPPMWAIGYNKDTPKPNFWYFCLTPSFMNIGQGAI